MSSVIHIIGGNGFIGRSVFNIGIQKGLNVKCWSHASDSKNGHIDLFDESTWTSLIQSKPEVVIILSWPNLPNYNKPFHLTKNLSSIIRLIDSLSSLKKLLIAGTCYEYGILNGQLSESDPVNPNTIYALGKDSLRRYVEIHSELNSYKFIWTRIFYPYGKHQNPNSLFPSLMQAIYTKAKSFQMASGTQIRDFINVNLVAEMLLFLITCEKSKGIYNVGSGKPYQIKDVVSAVVCNMNSNLQIEYGAFKDRESEPKEFWADISRIKDLGFQFSTHNLADDIIAELKV